MKSAAKLSSSGHSKRYHHQHRRQRQRSLRPEFGSTVQYIPSMMDTLLVEMGYTASHFQSVKKRICQVYQLLVEALSRHDPLPWLVRDAIESLVLAPPLLNVSQPQKQSLQARPSVATCMCLNSSGANSWGHPQQLSEKPRLQSKSDIDTITAMDIPYTLRHFDCDISAAVNISEGTSRRVTGGGTGGTVSFSLSEGRTTCARSRVSFENSKSDAPQRAVCRAIAEFLVTRRLTSIVRRAARATTTAGGNGSVCETSGTPAGTYAPHNSLASAASRAASSTVSSRTSSPSGLPMLKCHVSDRGGGGRCNGSRSLTAPIPLTAAGAMDGSNSNRATNTLMSNGAPSSFVSMVAPSEFGGSASTVGYGEAGEATGGVGIGRLCPKHLDRSSGPASESSCAVCASQHFLHRHLQRLAQESGGVGLARLEDALCDALHLQEQWRRSVRWVATCVKDNRLPESIRPLVRCVCAAETNCCGSCEEGGVRKTKK
ncbi:hypothetical protein BOX15_Mlig007622g1 [Macrostomum lignano]|uniref:Uncharacterized protein n=1 Tax=Macrostomum lignano TaxID=282301 RepID=A0A267FAA5_9PLAT|nr:hypothetical protein BOX15_Mlig007622g1 [Macrostomum lignano]